MNVKKSIKVAVAQRGITQNQLAEEMKVSPSTLSGMLSRNTVTAPTLNKMADALGMKVSELIALGE